MARHIEVIDVPLPVEQAFDAIADFSTTADWDPGVKAAVATTADPVRAGSRFRVEVEILGRTQTYGYAITEYDRPSRVVLRGGDGHVELTDEITFVSRGRHGTRITYEVRSRGVGLMRLFDPLVDLALPFIGRRAADGLRRYARTLALRSRADQATRSREAGRAAERVDEASEADGHADAGRRQEDDASHGASPISSPAALAGTSAADGASSRPVRLHEGVAS